jgi:hypothetical protein
MQIGQREAPYGDARYPENIHTPSLTRRCDIVTVRTAATTRAPLLLLNIFPSLVIPLQIS